jgi:16S rRNA (guanine527-N7)-methyltransferase
VEHETILQYFPSLTEKQIQQLASLGPLYRDWNEKVNVISRKDIEHLYVKHVLHSLGIAKVIQFSAGTTVLDIGTGGGFPGVPLAILFPDVRFHLVDSIGKKVRVVSDIAERLTLTNVLVSKSRVEELPDLFDFAVCRAVANLNELYRWTRKRIRSASSNSLPNGLLCLKGGSLNEELRQLNRTYNLFPLSAYFHDPFFVTKQVIHVPAEG